MSHWKQARWPFVVFVLIEVVIFGSGSAVTKFAYDSITPLWCLAARFGLATAVFALFFGRRIVARLRNVKVRLWLPQALCMGISYLCCNVALDLTTATNVGFLVALPVVFAPLLSTVVERSRYPRAIIPFQVGVAGGLYLLCSQGGSLAVGPGELLALGSSVALAGALVFGKQALAELDAVTVAGTQIAVAFALCLGCALAWEPMLDVAAVRPVAWGIIVFLALFSTCLRARLHGVVRRRDGVHRARQPAGPGRDARADALRRGGLRGPGRPVRLPVPGGDAFGDGASGCRGHRGHGGGRPLGRRTHGRSRSSGCSRRRFPSSRAAPEIARVEAPRRQDGGLGYSATMTPRRRAKAAA